mmetsp:Transcript_26138/g.90206  ORF Transcript_26138/g.90206 Transcript_26138/m.90206 type:complete len:442 (+) Transcript_26138:1769-3094(+)
METRRTLAPPSVRAKSARTLTRCAADIDPTSCAAKMPASSKAFWALWMVPTNAENATAFSSVGSAATAATKAETFGLGAALSSTKSSLSVSADSGATAAWSWLGEMRSCERKGARHKAQTAVPCRRRSEHVAQNMCLHCFKTRASSRTTSSRQIEHSNVSAASASPSAFCSWSSNPRASSLDSGLAPFAASRPSRAKMRLAAARRLAGTSDAPPEHSWRSRVMHSRTEPYARSASSPKASTQARAVLKSALYAARFSCPMSTSRVSTVFGTRTAARSAFGRRSASDRTSTRSRVTPAGSPSLSGREMAREKTCGSSTGCARRKRKSAARSSGLFTMGVPVRHQRWRVSSAWHAAKAFVRALRMTCASSSTTRSHDTANAPSTPRGRLAGFFAAFFTLSVSLCEVFFAGAVTASLCGASAVSVPYVVTTMSASGSILRSAPW